MTVAAPRGCAARQDGLPAVLEDDYDRACWRESAACRHADSELFFPVGSGGYAAMTARQAKAICARCPVRRECLAYALTSRQYFGIWGGYDEEERRPLHRRWREWATAPDRDPAFFDKLG